MASLGFKEIAGILREEIETGEFRPGALVPSETTLCARWGVSRTTIRRALGILEAESLITAIPGRGRVVKSTSEPAAMEGEGRAAFIARVLREDFLRGEVSNGALTSSTAVAERFAVSEATARDALKALSADGLITMAPGRGWHWRSGDTPLSKTDEIIRKLCDAIADGTWQVGERIPGELTLAAEYGVGRVTVRRAISRLVGEGILATKTGIGTVVLRRPEILNH